MARRWQCGFELTSLTEVSATGGTAPTLVTGVARTGTYALRTAATANTSFARYHYAAADQTAPGHQGISVQVETLPATTIEILRTSNAGNNSQAGVRQASNGLLTLWNSNNVQVTSVPGTTANATIGVDGLYHDLELKCDSTSSPGSISLWVDNVLIATATNFDQGANSRLVCGIINSATASYLWDDWKFNDGSGSSQTGRTGNGKILHIRPNGDGDNHAWSNTANAAGASTNYTLVNEVSPNSTTNYVQTGVATTKDYYTLDDTGLGSGDTINVVAVGLQLRNNTADATAAVKAGIKKVTGGTIAQGSAVVPNTASFALQAGAEPRNYSLVTYADPDGSPWTQATLDAAQAGIELTTAGTNRIQVSTLWVSIDYTPSSSTPITGSDTGSGAEASTLAAAITATETASAAEASTLTATGSSSDTGAGAEAAALAAALTGSETAAGVEASSLAASIAAPDTASGAEGSSLTATASSADTGTASESATLVVQIFDADTASAAEASALVTAITSPDAATATDQATDRTLTAGDLGAAAEASVLAAALSSGETAAGIDAATPSVSLTSSETAQGVEASTLAAQLTSAETATGGEGSAVDDGSGSNQNVTSSDTATSAEASTLTTVLVSADTATAVEAATVTVQITSGDTGTTSDSAVLAASLASSDTGNAVDATNALTAVLIAAETAQITDANALLVALVAADTAQALEAHGVDDGSAPENPLPPVVALITVGGRLDATITPTGRLSALVTRGE